MIFFIILTALSVSIDSFVCGFSLAFTNKKKLNIVLDIAITVFIMCLITNYLSFAIEKIFSQEVASCGGFILIVIGVINLINAKKTSTTIIKCKSGLKQGIAAGLAVGLDGAFANLSLALMGFNFFYVPVIIATFHGIMIYLGITLAHTRLAKKLDKIGIIPPLILILLGGYKILGLFI